eukprot:NODE_24140_length_637_cov_2.243137.p3 GENE.NODE_24140_length_637_cov_2.243137~~NODE_24140_length_637_cov_2.243137.p3  ORF type:complete len:56 (+),score=0.68 NODE_24140_length_637_cov_2.243137:257-424(+)
MSCPRKATLQENSHRSIEAQRSSMQYQEACCLMPSVQAPTLGSGNNTCCHISSKD